MYLIMVIIDITEAGLSVLSSTLKRFLRICFAIRGVEVFVVVVSNDGAYKESFRWK